MRTGEMSNRGLVGLGLAGGLVPCWDAVGLVVLAAALGRLAAGVGLVLAFSAGMAAVLVAVGWLAWKFKSVSSGSQSRDQMAARARSGRWRDAVGARSLPVLYSERTAPFHYHNPRS